MATLSLLRHAKAAQPLPGQQDFDRPLTERGRDDAAWAGAMLAPLQPDYALVSAARRTRETWEIASLKIAMQATVALEEELYLCSPSQLIARLQRIPPEVRSVVAVGHNPCMQEVAAWLTRHSKGPASAAIRAKFPTSALVVFELEDGVWATLAPELVKLKRFAAPRMTD
jgi:phosphohistidine phosphatase